MALHRDIFWIGRQWAVTGFGMQAINQKFGGEFDVAVERLWDDDLQAVLREQKWFNGEDFAKGLAVARTRYPQPPGKPAPPPPAVEPSIAAVADAPPIVAMEAAAEPAKPEKPAPSFPRLSIPRHPARLLRVWRMRLKE